MNPEIGSKHFKVNKIIISSLVVALIIFENLERFLKVDFKSSGILKSICKVYLCISSSYFMFENLLWELYKYMSIYRKKPAQTGPMVNWWLQQHCHFTNIEKFNTWLRLKLNLIIDFCLEWSCVKIKLFWHKMLMVFVWTLLCLGRSLFAY